MAGKEQAWAVLAEVLDLLDTRAKVSLVSYRNPGLIPSTSCIQWSPSIVDTLGDLVKCPV